MMTAAAKTAKIILGAAGLKAALLSKKTSVKIGGHSIPLKRTESIPVPVSVSNPTAASPDAATKKQSFVSSSTSTTIFDMSMLTSPPPGFSMYLSNGRKQSINMNTNMNSVGRIARFAADAVLTGSACTYNPPDSSSFSTSAAQRWVMLMLFTSLLFANSYHIIFYLIIS